MLLQHVPDHRAALAEMVRVVRPRWPGRWLRTGPGYEIRQLGRGREPLARGAATPAGAGSRQASSCVPLRPCVVVTASTVHKDHP